MDQKDATLPWIVDSTLRDGEQAAGVCFSAGQKLAIARMLDDAGVNELEIGTPAMGDDEISTIRAISQLNLRSRLTVWCRARAEDIRRASECNVECVHLCVPVSDTAIAALKKDRQWVLDRIDELTRMARGDFSLVSIGAMDAFRADPAFLLAVADAAEKCGADRLRFADTVGVSNPMMTHRIISRIASRNESITIGFHGHNDLGMAAANSIAALAGGASSIDVTVNGLGERAGNAALEQFVMACEISLGLSCSVDKSRLMQLSQFVAQAAHRYIAVDQPIVGENVFSHESGIHVHGLLSNRASFEPFDARILGRKGGNIILGKHSGIAALDHILSAGGVHLSDMSLKTLLSDVRNRAESAGGSVSHMQVADMARRFTVHNQGA